MQDTNLSHYGILGMRWGRRKARTWTKAPEGDSMRRQANYNQAKYKLKNTKGKEARKLAKEDVENAKKVVKNGYKEYRKFEKDMHKKIGRSSSIRTVIDSNGNPTYYNKKGQKLKPFEVRGAEDYELSRGARRAQVAVNGLMLATGALTIAELIR